MGIPIEEIEEGFRNFSFKNLDSLGVMTRQLIDEDDDEEEEEEEEEEQK